MNSYNKQALDIIAKEQGFIRANLEKVMRLVEILNYFHDSPLLSKSLVLKGGTAINLTVFRRFVRNSCLCLGAVSILTLKSQDRSERLSLKAIGSDRIRERICPGIQ